MSRIFTAAGLLRGSAARDQGGGFGSDAIGQRHQAPGLHVVLLGALVAHRTEERDRREARGHVLLLIIAGEDQLARAVVVDLELRLPGVGVPVIGEERAEPHERAPAAGILFAGERAFEAGLDDVVRGIRADGEAGGLHAVRRLFRELGGVASLLDVGRRTHRLEVSGTVMMASVMSGDVDRLIAVDRDRVDERGLDLVYFLTGFNIFFFFNLKTSIVFINRYIYK